jgi:PST family polysaccharide transporter
VQLTLAEICREASALLKLGTAFMLSGLLMMGSAYAIRILLLHNLGLEATGLYQAAWTLGGLYVGMILQAMGADFYPRLTEAAHDRVTCNRLVNEQARVSLLLAGPGVLATIVFAPFVVSVFYNAQFAGAIALLRWICLGVALRVISWPMGFIIMAQGEQRLIILCEVAWTAVHLGLAFVLVKWLGLNGAGIAFFGSYVFHIVLNYAVVSRLNGFRWSAENKSTGVVYLFLIAATFYVVDVLPAVWALYLGTLTALLFSVYSCRTLAELVPVQVLPLPLQKLLMRMGVAPAI